MKTRLSCGVLLAVTIAGAQRLSAQPPPAPKKKSSGMVLTEERPSAASSVPSVLSVVKKHHGGHRGHSRAVQRHFGCVVVDEFQDTTAEQTAF
jgi:hypothetical protein